MSWTGYGYSVGLECRWLGQSEAFGSDVCGRPPFHAKISSKKNWTNQKHGQKGSIKTQVWEIMPPNKIGKRFRPEVDFKKKVVPATKSSFDLDKFDDCVSCL